MPNFFMNLFSSSLSSDRKGESLRIDNLFDTCGNDECRINNLMDKYDKPLSAGKIYNRVTSMISNGAYCVINNNCEHYTKWCRYDIYMSQQMNVGKGIITGVKTFLESKSLLQASAAGVLEYINLQLNGSSKKHSQ
uniref:LRAT domain-containing protein n=1 Tax=Strongyloides papillosus TaxID=174720 RepID=A0A0N5BKG6_STREA